MFKALPGSRSSARKASVRALGRPLMGLAVLLAGCSGTANASQMPSPAGDSTAISAAAAPAEQRFFHRKVEVNGVRLHVVTTGNGPPVVLLHGWAETWATWRFVIPRLAAAGYTVVVPDLRGFGDSSKPPSGYDKKTVATDVVALMHALGYERFYVAGHDLGAQVAYALARFHAPQVEAVALLDAPVAGIPPWDELKASPRLWHWTFYNVPDLPETLISGHERVYFSWFHRQSAVDTEAADSDLEEIVAAYSQPGALRAGLAWFRAFDQDAHDNAGFAQDLLGMPVLALGGSGGNGDVPLRQMKLAARQVEGGVIADCGHWIPTERPAELAARLADFFNRSRAVADAREGSSRGATNHDH
jgi:pimeloyl-ACP methyl ester carboxylesterase